MRSNKAYGHIEVYSPDDRLMFHTNEKKLAFYKRKGLVEEMGEQKYRLKFVPNGLGHSDRYRGLLEPRINHCVRCGYDDLVHLTRHHVIPTRFRKYLPDYLKGNNYRYVVFLCRDCHDEYGVHENEFNEVLANELGTKSYKQCFDELFINKRKLVSIVDAILLKDGIPKDRVEDLKQEFRDRAHMEPTTDNLNKVRKIKYEPIDETNDFGRIVIDKYKNLYEFQQRWLEHFVITMSPLYLPNDLKVLLSEEILSGISA